MHTRGFVTVYKQMCDENSCTLEVLLQVYKQTCDENSCTLEVLVQVYKLVMTIHAF